MKIAIDLRSLSSGSISGVENYTLNLLDCLLTRDKKNSYTLFYNSFRNASLSDFHYINSKIVKTGVPNKILNLGLKFNAVSLEKVIGEFDCLFMPNLNQFNISPNAKLAITVHDLSPIVTPEFYNAKRRLWHKFLNYGKAFNRANVIFAVSEYTKRDLMRLFNLPEHKIKVVYPGIDRKIFKEGQSQGYLRDLRNRLELPGDYILFLNTIEPRKNLVSLIKAFNLLDWPGSLVIAGRLGWKYKETLREIKQSKKSGRIKYLGYISERDKPGIIKLATALAYPSFYEGFGFQPLEAMALSVPTMASGVTALPEVTGEASLLVNPHNVLEMHTALENLIGNKALRARLIEKGKKRAELFSWEKSADEVLQNLNAL